MNINTVMTNENFIKNRIIPIATIVLAIGLIQTWIHTFYFQASYIDHISWISADGNYPGKYRLGVHYFSDYLISVDQSRTANPWAQGSIYPPLAMAIFKFFSVFPYTLSLYLWLLFSLLCLLFPIVHVTRKFQLGDRVQIIAILGLFSAPVIATLDRGNCIFLLVPLLYFAWKYLESNPIAAGILFGLAGAIKIYPMLIVFFLFLTRKYKILIYTLTSFFSSSVIASLLWGNPIKTLGRSLSAINTFEGLDPKGQPMIFGFAGIIHNSILAFGFNGSFVQTTVQAYPRIMGILFLFLLVIASYFTTKEEQFLIYLTSLQFVLTVSYTYTRLWTLVAIPLLLTPNFVSKISNTRLKFWWLIILLSNTIASIFVFHPASLIIDFELLTLVFVLLHIIFFGIREQKKLVFDALD